MYRYNPVSAPKVLKTPEKAPPWHFSGSQACRQQPSRREVGVHAISIHPADADIANKSHRRRSYYSLLSLRHIADSLVILITMSIVSAQTDIIVVDSATTLLSLLNNLISLAVDPLSLYLDLEGVKLGRHGSISVLNKSNVLSNESNKSNQIK
jgi:hypothetical protein